MFLLRYLTDKTTDTEQRGYDMFLLRYVTERRQIGAAKRRQLIFPIQRRFEWNPFFLLAGALLFVEKIRQRAALLTT
jgi:hypothetical protein